ncbi:unnamed protein product, partial [marine sediment metagenome]
MKREDWDELDRLLGLEGFGGYYDLVECLKDIARSWITDVKDGLTDFEKIISKIDDIKTIKSAVDFLHTFDRLRKIK